MIASSQHTDQLTPGPPFNGRPLPLHTPLLNLYASTGKFIEIYILGSQSSTIALNKIHVHRPIFIWFLFFSTKYEARKRKHAYFDHNNYNDLLFDGLKAAYFKVTYKDSIFHIESINLLFGIWLFLCQFTGVSSYSKTWSCNITFR